MKRLAELLNSAKRFKPSYKFCTSFLPSLFVPVGSLLSARRYIYVKLSWGLNYPSPLWLEELHANRKAFALQWLAVCNAARGTKPWYSPRALESFVPRAALHTASHCKAKALRLAWSSSSQRGDG